MTVHFTIVIAGSGTTIQACWEDAALSFCLEPGKPPDDKNINIIEGEEEDV
jgi:hypothetical protein